MQKKIRIYSYLLPLSVLCFLFVFWIFFTNYYKVDGDMSVEIVSPSEKIVQPLHKNQLIVVHGLTGNVIVQIKNKEAKILSSNCPDQVCVKSVSISNPGPMIVCAPNKVMMRIINQRIKSNTTY